MQMALAAICGEESSESLVGRPLIDLVTSDADAATFSRQRFRRTALNGRPSRRVAPELYLVVFVQVAGAMEPRFLMFGRFAT